jgi:hypothetical protein
MTAPITYVRMTSTETVPRTLVLAAPDSVTWNQGIQEQIINETNDRGEMIFSEAIVSQKEPGLTLNYAKCTKELMALKLGWKLDNQALTDALFCKSFRVTQATYAAAPVGVEGNGMLADQATSECFALIDGISTPLTRQPFATFVPATVLSFAQGADGAMKFSTDLVALKPFVTPVFVYPVAAADVMIDDPFESFKLTLLGVLTENFKKRLFTIDFDSVQVNRQENSQIDFKASPMPLSFRIVDTGCYPKVRFTNVDRKC